MSSLQNMLSNLGHDPYIDNIVYNEHREIEGSYVVNFDEDRIYFVGK